MSHISDYTGNLVGDTQPYSYATLQRMLTAAEIRITRLENQVAALSGSKKSGAETSATEAIKTALDGSSVLKDDSSDVSPYSFVDGKLSFAGSVVVLENSLKAGIPKRITTKVYSSEKIENKIFLTGSDPATDETDIIGNVLVQQDGMYFTVTNTETDLSAEKTLYFTTGVPNDTKVKFAAVDSPSGILVKQ